MSFLVDVAFMLLIKKQSKTTPCSHTYQVYMLIAETYEKRVPCHIFHVFSIYSFDFKSAFWVIKLDIFHLESIPNKVLIVDIVI